MALRFFLFILPAFVDAGFSVIDWFVLKNNGYGHGVRHSGQTTDIISRYDRYAFKLSDHNLKNGVRAYFGRLPDDAFLRSPTPWGDLYKTYNWTQVKRSLNIRRFRILSATYYIQTRKQQVFREVPGGVEIGLTETVEETFSSSWTMARKLSVPHDVSHYVYMSDDKLDYPVTFSIKSRWGRPTNKSYKVTIGSLGHTAHVTQDIISELHATNMIYVMETTYVSSLTGSVAVNYDEIYKCHHHWSLPIEDVMSHGRLKNEFLAREVVKAGYWINNVIVLRDLQTGAVIGELPYHVKRQ